MKKKGFINEFFTALHQLSVVDPSGNFSWSTGFRAGPLVWLNVHFCLWNSILYLKKLLKEGALDSVGKNGQLQKATEEDIFNFIATGIVFLLIGARIFSTLVYDTSGIYWKKPWLIFWPFNSDGHFTGLAGMSYHGGFIGGLIGMIFWCAKNKRPALKWIDAMVTAIPLGYTFGRLGNFKW